MGGRTQDEVAPLLVEVKDNLDQDLSLQSLAREFGASPFHFHRLFSTAVGETPRRHVQRLRLERAAYKLAITDDSIIQVGLSVGFGAHETFSRAFRRGFGLSPSAYRRACKAAQVERMERNRGFRGDGCSLSEVWFAEVAPAQLLAMRHVGQYRLLGPSERAGVWAELERWAAGQGAVCGPMRIGLFPDDPNLTPPQLQACDLCIPVDRPVPGDGRVRSIELAGGLYAMIGHVGPSVTVDQAYRNLADAIRRSGMTFREDPPVQLFLGPGPQGEAAERFQVCFPVRRPPARKKRQDQGSARL
jgi:AraC family transcriptional regulator